MWRSDLTVVNVYLRPTVESGNEVVDALDVAEGDVLADGDPQDCNVGHRWPLHWP